MSPRLIRVKAPSSVRESAEFSNLFIRCRDEWLRCKIQEIEKDLKKDRELGAKIPKFKWPKYYVKRWGITNLYKCNLGSDWRLIYTLVFDGAGIAVLCLEVLSHKEYEKIFGYRTT